MGRRALTPAEKTAIAAIDIARCSPQQRLAYWFPQAHKAALDSLLQLVLELPPGVLQRFFLCAFSNILRACSIWLSGSTKPQKDLAKTLADPAAAFRSQVREMLRRNRLYWEELADAAPAAPIYAASATLALEDAHYLPLANGVVDLLVTSPPYATCYQYIELHQLTHLFLESRGALLPSDARHSCIGAKHIAERQAATSTASTTGSLVADAALDELAALAVGSVASTVRGEVRALRHYFQDMRRVLDEFARVVGVGKRMALVVGNSTKRGILIPTAAALQEMACASGFNLEERIVRAIPGRVLVSTRDGRTGRFSSVAASDTRVYPEEEILVFSRRV